MQRGEHMTIKEYMQGLQELPHRADDGQTIADAMAETTRIWSNDACLGYCIKAMQGAGLQEEQQAAVLHWMHIAFDELTVEQAEQVCYNPAAKI